MNKYLLAAFLGTLCGACQDQELFNRVFADAGKPGGEPAPSQDMAEKDMAAPAVPLFWEEKFQPFFNQGEKGQNQTRSSVAYWILTSVNTDLLWFIFKNDENSTSSGEDSWNVLNFRFRAKDPTPITAPPLAAYAILNPPLARPAQQLTLCIKYYLLRSRPVDLKISLLGPDLKALASAEGHFDQVAAQSVYMKLLFDGLKNPVHGIQMEYKSDTVSKLESQYMRITMLSLREGILSCN